MKKGKHHKILEWSIWKNSWIVLDSEPLIITIASQLGPMLLYEKGNIPRHEISSWGLCALLAVRPQCGSDQENKPRSDCGETEGLLVR